MAWEWFVIDKKSFRKPKQTFSVPPRSIKQGKLARTVSQKPSRLRASFLSLFLILSCFINVCPVLRINLHCVYLFHFFWILFFRNIVRSFSAILAWFSTQEVDSAWPCAWWRRYAHTLSSFSSRSILLSQREVSPQKTPCLIISFDTFPRFFSRE